MLFDLESLFTLGVGAAGVVNEMCQASPTPKSTAIATRIDSAGEINAHVRRRSLKLGVPGTCREGNLSGASAVSGLAARDLKSSPDIDAIHRP
ncbi:Uncharacterised protein [Mycobacteroides abscessus subsp. abscessus]|nr:Uncharacterised protein [Mycobacteroides abscessus subsp. abscessus]